MTGAAEATADLLRVLEAIDAGTDAVVYTGDDPEWDAFSGNVPFRSVSGWTLVVFNDCEQWDYLDSAISPSGVPFGFDDIPAWRPRHPERWRIGEQGMA